MFDKIGIAVFIGIFMLLSSVCVGDCESQSDILKNELKKCVSSGKILFGQEDALMYGRNWLPGTDDFRPVRSDVGDVCGRHPKVLGLDLGGIESGDSCNLDNVSFENMAKAAISHYENGGVVTFSWHLSNPETDGDSWDVSGDSVVASILPGGENHVKFTSWLSCAVDFLSSLKSSDGKSVPVILRFWHEHTGNWFWWGDDHCTVEEYVGLWRMTVDYFVKERGMDNILWAYSPNSGVDKAGYMKKYPGDEFVDILGLDSYQFDRQAFASELSTTLSYMSELGTDHGKMIALTEIGYEGVPDAEWWTKILYPVIESSGVAYVMVWRNAYKKDNHFYGPYPGAVSEENFRNFAASEKIVLR